MSPRAACRLESLGFQEVYDYAAGEADWFAYGLPMEGTNASIPHAGDLARRDVPTCRLDDDLRDVVRRLRASDWDACPVTNDERVVLGLLRRDGSAT
jgi:hypothetical protein